MRERIAKFGGIVCVVVVLAVVLVGGHAAGLVCFSQGSGGPPTMTQGPVTMSTDHSVYGSSDTIPVTITNHFDTAIALLSEDSPSGICPIVALDILTANELMTSCSKSTEAGPAVLDTTIGAHASVTFDFDSAHLDTPLINGTYQAATRWGPFPFRGSRRDASRHATGIVSNTFRVCTCRSC